MKSVLFFIAILFYIPQNISAQPIEHNVRIDAVKKVIDGYNNQDYKAMRQPWVGWAKLFVTKNKLQKQYGPFYKQYGNASIEKVTFSSKYEYVAKLKMEHDKNAARYFSFIFSEQGKVEGLGETYPPLMYTRRMEPKPINQHDFRNKVDSLLILKYLKSKTRPFNGSIMVLDNGKPIYKKHCGYADFNLKNEINDSTLFDLASVSKQFTATAILLLAKNGKLKLSDTVQKYIPDFPYYGITIYNLLTHTSGLPEYMGLLKKHWDKSAFATNYNVLDVLKTQKTKVAFLPGERFEYCNTGYVMLSIIIEKISGKSYSAFLKENIFNPLGMVHTRVYNTRRVTGEKIDNAAQGYVYSNEKSKYVLPDSTLEYQEVIYLDAITGDGNINSCLQDLLLWENELLNPKIIDSNIFREMMVNRVLENGDEINYGYGFFLSPGKNYEPLVYHTGGWPGYLCIVMNFFDQKKQIIILSNNSYESFTRIADDIATLLIE